MLLRILGLLFTKFYGGGNCCKEAISLGHSTISEHLSTSSNLFSNLKNSDVMILSRKIIHGGMEIWEVQVDQKIGFAQPEAVHKFTLLCDTRKLVPNFVGIFLSAISLVILYIILINYTWERVFEIRTGLSTDNIERRHDIHDSASDGYMAAKEKNMKIKVLEQNLLQVKPEREKICNSSEVLKHRKSKLTLTILDNEKNMLKIDNDILKIENDILQCKLEKMTEQLREMETLNKLILILKNENLRRMSDNEELNKTIIGLKLDIKCVEDINRKRESKELQLKKMLEKIGCICHESLKYKLEQKETKNSKETSVSAVSSRERVAAHEAQEVYGMEDYVEKNGQHLIAT